MPDSVPSSTTPPAQPNKPAQAAKYGGEALNRYSRLTPLFWHGMRLREWRRLLREHGWRISGRGYQSLPIICGLSLVNSTMSAYDHLRYGRRIDRVELPAPPLFVLGHWRSGTTMLHEMLINDPQHTYPNTYQCFAPHHFNSTERWVTPVSGWLLPKKRPMDNVAMGWQQPQEDEFALMNLGVPSPYRCWAFPDDGPVDPQYLTLNGLSDDELRRWRNSLERFVKAVTLKDRRRVVLKSPPHTARVGTILDIFPDAKFVHLVRDPLTLFPSTVRMWQSLCDTQGLQRPRPHNDWIEPYVLDNLTEMYAAYERDRPTIPAGQIAEVRYEDLVAHPRSELRRIYGELNLGDFARVEPPLDDYLASHGSYQKNRYELTPEVEATVRTRWADYFEWYGY